jgi:hypothetical protein
MTRTDLIAYIDADIDDDELTLSARTEYVYVLRGLSRQLS